MKKLLLVSLSALTISTQLHCTPEQEDFNKAMRELWSDHAVWTRQYTVATIAKLPQASHAAKRLLRNQVDIGNAIVPFYGKKAGKELADLLTTHINIAVDFIAAAQEKKRKEVKKQNKLWHDNARDISTFLSSANPHIPKKAMTDLLFEHLALTAKQVNLLLRKQWAADVKNYDAIRTQLNHMADTLAEAIVLQFPKKFGQRAELP